MTEILHSNYKAGDVLTVGSVFSAGSGTTFISGLNHITNAINILNVSGGSAAYTDHSMYLIHSAGSTLTTVTNAVIGSYVFTANQFASGDYVRVQVAFDNNPATSRTASILVRYSGVGITAGSTGAQNAGNEFVQMTWNLYPLYNNAGSSMAWGNQLVSSSSASSVGSTGAIAPWWITGSGELQLVGSFPAPVSGDYRYRWWIYRVKGM